MASEKWLPIEGWPEYEVSNFGQVRSLKKKGVPRILRQVKRPNGYPCIMLWDSVSKKGKTLYVHRLVATAFVSGDKSLQVGHLDGSRDNNVFSNLKWQSQRENIQQAINDGKIGQGEHSHLSKTCGRCRLAMRQMRESGMILKDIAYFFGVSETTVSLSLELKLNEGQIRKQK